MNHITAYHAKFFAHFLTRKLPANDLDKLTASLHDAQVDLTQAALFAFKSPLSNGAILADEVGLRRKIGRVDRRSDVNVINKYNVAITN